MLTKQADQQSMISKAASLRMSSNYFKNSRLFNVVLGKSAILQKFFFCVPQRRKVYRL